MNTDFDPHSLLKDVNPILADKVRALNFAMTRIDQPLRVAQGWRSSKQQMDLWQIGRDAHGNIIGKPVTWAPPLRSWHNFGLAVDVVPISLLDKHDWDPMSQIWMVLGLKGEELGLQWGGRWRKRDLPHFQMPGSYDRVSPDEEVLQAFQGAGLSGVWKEAGLTEIAETADKQG